MENTKKILDRLHSCACRPDCLIDSFDVTALYTKIDNIAFQALFEVFDEHESSSQFSSWARMDRR